MVVSRRHSSRKREKNGFLANKNIREGSCCPALFLKSLRNLLSKKSVFGLTGWTSRRSQTIWVIFAVRAEVRLRAIRPCQRGGAFQEFASDAAFDHNHYDTCQRMATVRDRDPFSPFLCEMALYGRGVD